MHKENIPEVIHRMIARYLNDKSEVSAAELQLLIEWMKASPENRLYVEQQQAIWLAAGLQRPSAQLDANEAYHTFLGKVQTEANRRTVKSRYSLKKAAYWTGAAAVAFLVLFFTLRKDTIHPAHAALVTIEATSGSTTKIALPDCTSVVLNSGSKIVYAANYGISNRDIQLVGEGYFDVKKNSKLPLVVHTADMDAQVIGTKFNFKNYPEDREASLSLFEGKVKVNNKLKDGQAYLIPNQKIVLCKKNGSTKLSHFDLSSADTWTKGALLFDEELLMDIAAALERTYGVQITITDDTLANRRFYGDFRRANTISEILDLLSETGKISYTVNGKTIRLMPAK